MGRVALRHNLAIALTTGLLLLTSGTILFGAALATNVVPPFARQFAIGDQAFVEITNGRVCPPHVPSTGCYYRWLGRHHEFNVVYHAPQLTLALISIELPEP
jgi:hypothetical protein